MCSEWRRRLYWSEHVSKAVLAAVYVSIESSESVVQEQAVFDVRLASTGGDICGVVADVWHSPVTLMGNGERVEVGLFRQGCRLAYAKIAESFLDQRIGFDGGELN